MKYIDAEKLKAEIERRREKCADIAADERNEEVAEYYRGKEVAYDETSSFITSFQQEQSDNEDIDKIAQELYEHLYELKRRNNVPTNLYDKQEIIDIWKAGIEYGRSHPRQEKPEVDYNKFEKLFHDFCERNKGHHTTPHDACMWFWELGLNARKEE